jgi:hypothetical protein
MVEYGKTVVVPNDVILGEFIMEYVHKNGYPDHKLQGYAPVIRARTFSKDRVNYVVGRGTDRDFFSAIHHPQHRDAIDADGLGAGDIIYVTVVGELSEKIVEGRAIAAYDSEKLAHVPNGGPMYKEKAPHTFSDALIAVFVSE